MRTYTLFHVEFKRRGKRTYEGRAWRTVFSSPDKSAAREYLRQRQPEAPHNKYRLKPVRFAQDASRRVAASSSSGFRTVGRPA